MLVPIKWIHIRYRGLFLSLTSLLSMSFLRGKSGKAPSLSQLTSLLISPNPCETAPRRHSAVQQHQEFTCGFEIDLLWLHSWLFMSPNAVLETQGVLCFTISSGSFGIVAGQCLGCEFALRRLAEYCSANDAMPGKGRQNLAEEVFISWIMIIQ